MAASAVPKVYRKLVAVSLSNRFREAVKIQTVETPDPGPEELLVRTRYVGINASDINWTAGRYIPGVQPPLDTGFEGAGLVQRVGEKCQGFSPGDAVAFMHNGAFGEYLILPARRAIPIPRLDAGFVSLIVSGPTASISLERVGDLKAGETVLVTAAAGGTGQFAVQMAKLAGCHVIGTCSSEEKAAFLRQLGCDRPVNYKKENLKAVLKQEYPKGVDVTYESVGGEMFNTAVKNVAVGGRLIIIGYITHYQDSTFVARPTVPIPQILLQKSASLRGFFLNHYLKDFPAHSMRLTELYMQGKLQVRVDSGEEAPGGPFRGLEAVYDAVDYLYSGRSQGKVVVDLWTDHGSKL